MFVALKTEHERQLNEITERFESIKHSLSVGTRRLVILSLANLCIIYFVEFTCFL